MLRLPDVEVPSMAAPVKAFWHSSRRPFILVLLVGDEDNL